MKIENMQKIRKLIRIFHGESFSLVVDGFQRISSYHHGEIWQEIFKHKRNNSEIRLFCDFPKLKVVLLKNQKVLKEIYA